ncbi:hypothetical protein T05_11991 [Trichinella murrelli]|uniref:CCHC-type domain-containing protein n=1 Tax=Trichinella murrelli TaxID=144512 RepID=A0A0V0TWM9_9BILA|nr:hypothetical protein T05_11991 [Trichinella murrelli]
MVRINRTPDGATNGERGRIDGPEWVRPPEVLTMVSNVETWFEHMELYFRAGRIAPERRAALVQYHTDAEVRSIMRAMDVQETDDYDGLKSALFEAFGVRTGPERFSAEFFRRKQQRGECVRVFAGHLRRLFSKAFPEMSGSADKILLQQFKAGLSADAVKTAVLRSEMDNFAEAVEVAVKEERVVRELTTLEASVASVKTDAYQEDEPTAGRVTEAAAAAVTTRKEVGDDLAEVLRQLKELLTDNTPAATKRPLPRQRRRPERRGDRRCWKCGGLGHISRECQASSRDARASEVSITNRTLPVVVIRAPEIETPIVEGSVGGVRCDMLVDTGSAVTLANERFIRHSKTMRDVPKPLIRLETASGTELEIRNACVTEIVLGKSVTVQHTVLCVRELSHKIMLGWDFMLNHGCTPDPTAGCLRMRHCNIPFLKSHAVAPVRAESSQSELMAHHPAHEAMVKTLSRVRGRVVHVRRGPRTDRRGTPRHLYPRRLTSEVLPKPHILSSTGAGGNPPGRNAAAGCRRTIKQSLRIPYRTSEEERRVMPVLFDFRKLNNVIRKDPTRSRGSTTLSTRWRVHNGFWPGPGKRILAAQTKPLPYTGKRVKNWGCFKDKKVCEAGLATNLDVSAVIRRTPHVDDCQVDEHKDYRMEKRAIL